MRIENRWLLGAFLVSLALADHSGGYPYDGYGQTGIRRLDRIRLIVEKQLPGVNPVSEGLRRTSEIALNLLSGEMTSLPEVEPKLQARLEALFPNRHESYSVALMDITPGRPVRYAAYQAKRTFSPGSVGKLAIAAGLFAELKAMYPDSVEERHNLLRTRMVTAGAWVRGDHHDVPIFHPEDRSFVSRPIQEGDVFSLYEWADHMLSASANAAASTVWKEVMLMRAFGKAYPPSPEAEAAFFRDTPKQTLGDMAISVVNDPLRAMGIADRDWRLGSFFTPFGQRAVPAPGGSYATPRGLLLFLMRMEQGQMIDDWSSLELKRLMYMTAKRIRYASSPALTKSAVYFKSGSLYRCAPEPDFKCGKYMGNVENAMNSVAVVERPDGRVYLVALMSNVLRKNSAVDHQTLATEIDRILRD